MLMIEISSASIAFCLVLILVGLLLVVLYFCEFGSRGRGEMMEDSYSNVLTTVVEENCNKSKFMTRWEVPWPLREATRKNNNETNDAVIENCERRGGCRTYSTETHYENDSEISQPDRIYTRFHGLTT